MNRNRSKEKGTAAESAVVRAFEAAGLPAHRVALKSGGDLGDVWVCGGRLVIQCKAGNQVARASANQVKKWFAEAQEQGGRVTHCDLAVLVLKPVGIGLRNAHMWRAYVDWADLWALDQLPHPQWSKVECITLGELIDDLVARGWGL